MGPINPFKDGQSVSLTTRKFFRWTLYVLLVVAILRLYFYSSSLYLSQTFEFSRDTPSSLATESPPPPPPPELSYENAVLINASPPPSLLLPDNPILVNLPLPPPPPDELPLPNPVVIKVGTALSPPDDDELSRENPIVIKVDTALSSPPPAELSRGNPIVINTSLSSPPPDELSRGNPIVIKASPPPPPPPPPSKEGERGACDYGKGKWVHDKVGPLYSAKSCGTIKDGQNCMRHGRPDKGYLYWRWRPNQCELPRFDAKAFLQIMRNKHIAFVGDSIARNQLESLVCLLATVSPPKLLYRRGEDNKFRRWHFPSHNVKVSIYWSPFLVKGSEKSAARNYNKLYLESVDERWASDLNETDMIVLSVGHWFLHPAVYFEGGSALGCHFCEANKLNYSEVGFYEVFGKAIKTSLEAIIERRGRDRMDAIVTTFSPHHFEGEWDKFGACPKTRPFKEGEKELEGMDGEMRKAEIRAVEAAKAKAKAFGGGGGGGLRIEALDISKLSLMRPDGHPGPYMHPFPFANGVQERVQNDCVHWCMPGPVDTWNEILLDVMKRWRGDYRRPR